MEIKQAVKDAIDIGYRHIDCAHVYVRISSSRGNCGILSIDPVEGAIKTTLSNLQLKYLDLYLIHWPLGYKEEGELFPTGEDSKIRFSDVDYVDTWKEIGKLEQKGLTKSIGLSNFNKRQIERILSVATIKPVTNQVECHPYLNQRKLIDFCKSKDITITGYSPLGSPDRPWAKPGDPQLLEDPKLKEVAKKYNKTPAQVLLRYQIQRGVITIPQSVTKSRIEQNFNVFDFELH